MSYPPDRYHDEHGETSALSRLASTAPDLVYPSGVRVHYLMRGSDPKSGFGLYRWDFTAEVTGPDPHFHRAVCESFYILSGSVALHDGRAWADAGPGDFFSVPPGAIHGFRNTSGVPASMLLLFTPGAPREEYFETLAHLAEHPMNDAEREAFMLRHDTYWL
jgi:mannose-6-phosphate isomerase-like protein (cupin superfamily)